MVYENELEAIEKAVETSSITAIALLDGLIVLIEPRVTFSEEGTWNFTLNSLLHAKDHLLLASDPVQREACLKVLKGIVTI